MDANERNRAYYSRNKERIKKRKEEMKMKTQKDKEEIENLKEDLEHEKLQQDLPFQQNFILRVFSSILANSCNKQTRILACF